MNLWYKKLIKPPFTPPPTYFPVAWTILYILIAISFLIILFKPTSGTKYLALGLFFIQMIFNLFWTYIFFDLKSIKLAILDVILLFIFLIPTIILFWGLSKIAAILLIPYLLQIILAIYLTCGIYILNK